MLSITNPPPPAASTSLRAPQADLNARRIRADWIRAFFRTFAILALVVIVTVGVGALALKAAANTTATVEQTEAWRAM